MTASVWNPGGQQQVPALPAIAPVSFIKNLVSNPGINFVGDTDTGIWSESDGYLNLVSNGITVLRIDPQGNIQGNKFASGVELSIASAATCDIGSLATNSVQITGTSTIGSFGTNYKGPMFVRFASALQLTYNSTQLITPGAANISVVAGDSCIVVPKATAGTADGWVIISYTSSAPILNAVSSINGGQLAGLRNRIINGGMQVAQRGNVAITNGNVIYGGCDRFISAMFGFTTGSGTLQQVQIPGPTTGYWNAIASFTTTGAGTLGQYQRIEAKNCQDLNSKTITISGKAYQDTGSTLTFTTTLSGATALDNFTGTTTIGAPQAISLVSGVVTPISYQVTLGASSAVNGLQVGFTLAALAHTGKNFFVADVQLEIGSVATPFEQRPYGMELALCQRYYEISPNIQFVAYSSPGNYIGQTHPFKVTKRAVPIVSGTSSYANTSGLSATPSIDGIYIVALVTALGAASWQYTNVSVSAEL